MGIGARLAAMSPPRCTRRRGRMRGSGAPVVPLLVLVAWVSLAVASPAGAAARSERMAEVLGQVGSALLLVGFSALFVGGLGVFNSVHGYLQGKLATLATLRALGMTPTQVGSLITTQTAVIGMLSGLAAIPLGIVMAFVLIKVINRRAFGWQIDMAVAPGILFSAILFAVGASLLAGLYPAYRASRSEPAVAMREE